jgi:hypothetical protein
MKDTLDMLNNPRQYGVENQEAWKLFKNDPIQFQSRAQDFVNKYAL